MRLPEIAYRFSISPDQAGPTFELAPEFQTISGTTVSLTINVTGVPKDRVLCLMNIQVSLKPTGGEAVTRAVVLGQSPSGILFNIHQEVFAGVADQREEMNWQGEIYIGGSGRDGTIYTCQGIFDGAIQSNTVDISTFGVVIPRGNIAPF